jgi:hypothetical protein
VEEEEGTLMEEKEESRTPSQVALEEKEDKEEDATSLSEEDEDII